MNITEKLSPHFNSGRQNTNIDRIVIHWIAEGTAHTAANWFQSPNSQVSAHYIVGNDVLYRCVKEENTAWHSGNWQMNLRSIGIEHEARPDLPATDTVYENSAELIAEICERYSIPIDREHIIGHRDVKATACPGTIDIDKLISMAKGDDMDCQKELDEMRESRNYWKQKVSDLEQTLETERDDHAKEISSKNEIIEQYSKQTAQLQLTVEKKEQMIIELTKQKEQLSGAYKTLEDKHQAYRSESIIVINDLKAKLADSEIKRKKAEQKVNELSIWDFIRIKFGGGSNG